MRAEEQAEKKIDENISRYDAARADLTSIIVDIDKELNDHFSLKHWYVLVSIAKFFFRAMRVINSL